MEIKNNDKQEIAYQDDYFARRHWVRKIWQTLVALLCWLVLLTPCVITLGTYLAYVTDGRRGFFFWHYREGFGELDLLIVLLVIIGVVTAIFCLLVGAVQNRRRKRVLERLRSMINRRAPVKSFWPVSWRLNTLEPATPGTRSVTTKSSRSRTLPRTSYEVRFSNVRRDRIDYQYY